MSNDEMTVLTNRVGRACRARISEPAGYGPKAGLQATVVHRHARGLRGTGAGQAGPRRPKRLLTPSVLAVALASLLPLNCAMAQENTGADARDPDPPAGESAAGQDTLPGPSAQPGDDSGEKPAPRRAEATEMEQVTVTGTRIRGGTSPSPVITIGSEKIREEGFADLGEVIRSVPQNFSGGQNPGVLMGNVTGGGLANQNITGGSGLNLRGLGPDASLTLLDGRRMSYGGFVQAVDISAIPVEAVERLEVVPDGASAIYGSDAVGGVANVILRRDFDGVALGARHGMASDGGLTTRDYTATAGTTWNTGGLIATLKNGSTDPIYARQRSYTDHLIEPTTIYPGSRLRSGLLSIHQEIGGLAELRLDALRVEREQDYYYYYGNTVRYNLLTPETTAYFAAPSIEFSLPGDWSLALGGSWGHDRRISEHTRVNSSTGVYSLDINNCYCNAIRTHDLGVEGPLFGLPGGDARLAAGIGSRKNEYVQPNYLTGNVDIRADEGVRFAYAELNLPLAGVRSEIANLRRLELTVAARMESYDSFGSVTVPKLGLVYGPNASLTVRASWGRSFKAPTLYEQHNGQNAILDPASYYGATDLPSDATILWVSGGNPDLDPERARTRTVSVAFHPEALPGVETELTWFDIDYADRVVQPITGDDGLLTNPIYAEFIDRSPTAERLATILDGVTAFYNLTGAEFDPNTVAAIIDARYVNATRQRIKGIDFSGSYRVNIGAGQLKTYASISWLESSQQTAGNPVGYELAGMLHNPAKMNGRAGFTWAQGGFSSSVFANYAGGVTNPSDGRRGASFTTLDTTLRYGIGKRSGPQSGLEFMVAASNLLDRAPPSYEPVASLYVAPYDSTNYSPIGRFLSVSVSKRW